MSQLSLFPETELEELVKPTVETEYGQLWQLGQHRLLIGDSRNHADIARLFGNERATVCFTSPPYTDQRDYDGAKFDWTELMCKVFDNAVAFGTPDIHILVNLGLSHKDRKVNFYWQEWLNHAEQVGWPLFGQYVWDKGPGMPGNWSGRLAPSFEFIFHFNQECDQANKWVRTLGHHVINDKFRQKDGKIKAPTSPDKFGQDYKLPDNVIRLSRELERDIHTANHPAVFPVALPEFIYKTWGKPGEIVFEPFSGSGSSIIAGERQKRRVFACERVPEYSAIAIERWQQLTKQKAILIDSVKEAA